MPDPNVRPTRAIDPDPEDERAAPPRHQGGHSGQSGVDTPGDLGAPDIVGPTGEEMPVQDHDDVDGDGTSSRGPRRD